MYSFLHSFGFCMMLLLGAVLHWRLAMAVPAILALPTILALVNLVPVVAAKAGTPSRSQRSRRLL